MKIVQVHLSKDKDHMACWLPADAGLHKGSVVSLKDLEGKWTVQEVYTIVMEQHDIKRKWNVGGL